MLWLISAGVAAAMTVCLLRVLMPWGARHGLLSGKPKPHDPAEQRPPTPCVGGLAIMVSMLAVFGVTAWIGNVIVPRWLVGLAIGTLLLLLVGLRDDRRQLHARWILFIQCLAALVAYLFGVRVEIAYFPLGVNLLLTVLWLVLMSNALNFMDILDGLAGGVALISAIGFALAAMMAQHREVVLFASILTGSLAGFVWANFYPARVYLGNHGSLALGFLLSALALPISYAPAGREAALCAPVLILGFPLIDVFYVILMRFTNGRAIWKGSRDHLALRLVALGWSERSVVVFLYVCSTIFMGAGLSLIRLGNGPGLVLLVGALLLVGAIAYRAARVSISLQPHV